MKSIQFNDENSESRSATKRRYQQKSLSPLSKQVLKFDNKSSQKKVIEIMEIKHEQEKQEFNIRNSQKSGKIENAILRKNEKLKTINYP